MELLPSRSCILAAFEISWNQKSSGNAPVERRQVGTMSSGKLEQVGVGCPACSFAPLRPCSRSHVVWQERVGGAKHLDHALEHGTGLIRSNPAARSLNRDADEAEFRDRRGQELRAEPSSLSGEPNRDARMIGVVSPSPSDQQIDVEEVVHGKSDSISQTELVVSGGSSGPPEKAIDPTISHLMIWMGTSFRASPRARLRRNSDTESSASRACLRISSASSSVTLNESVFIGNTVLPNQALSNGGLMVGVQEQDRAEKG